MKYGTEVKRWVKEYREKQGITRKDFAIEMKCSLNWIDIVLNHLEPAPWDFVQRLAKILKKDLEIISIHFGYYPADWIWFARTYPEHALAGLIEIMDKHDVYWSGKPQIKRTPATLQTRIRQKDLREILHVAPWISPDDAEKTSLDAS